MAHKRDLRAWVVEALRSLGGRGSVLEVSRVVWQLHETELRQSGDLFYTWQYDVRWAAQGLRESGYLKAVETDRRAPWTLTAAGRETELSNF